MATKVYHRNIKGSPYVISRYTFGWKVTADSAKTDHFYRSYLVQTNEEGTPYRCDCADCTYRKVACKHVKMVQEIVREEVGDEQ
jgi:hypothetical protein